MVNLSRSVIPLLLLIYMLTTSGCFDSGSGSSSNKADSTPEESENYSNYQTLSTTNKKLALAKLSYMAAMSNGFTEPYGTSEPNEEQMAKFYAYQTDLLETLENTQPPPEDIEPSQAQGQFHTGPFASALPGSDARGTPPIINSAEKEAFFHESLRRSAATQNYTKSAGLLSDAWDFIVNGLGGSSKRARDKALQVIDELSPTERDKAYKSLTSSGGVAHHRRDELGIEDNADDFWQGFREGKYDNQAAQWHNALSHDGTLDYPFVAEEIGERPVDRFVKEGADLAEKGRNLNPSIDGNILGDEIEEMVASEMQKDVQRLTEKHQEHVEQNYNDDPDSAAEELGDAVQEYDTEIDETKIEQLEDAVKNLDSSIIKEDTTELPSGNGQLTILDSNTDNPAEIIIATGENSQGEPMVFTSDVKKTSEGGEEGITASLPEGDWNIEAININSILDSIISHIQEGIETLSAIDTSAPDEQDQNEQSDLVEGEEGWNVSRSLIDQTADTLTYRVAVTVTGITDASPVQITIDVSQGVVESAPKTLTQDGTVTFEPVVGSSGGFATVSRSDSSESLTITLPGTESDYALNLSAAPASPAAGHSVTVTATITPAEENVRIRFIVSGTDGYDQDSTPTTNSAGQAQISIPGGESGVRDTITATIIKSGQSRTFSYTFAGGD